jgi:cation transport protein ChaC
MPDLRNNETRQRLIDGTFVKMLWSDPPPGLHIRNDAELQATLDAALLPHDPTEDLHIFGYGSLMWNPALDVVHTRTALVPGWHRRYCIRLLAGRGTPASPGAMLALDRGGACRGLLFRIEADKVAKELQLLWRREMLAGSYDARWVWAEAEGKRVRALTFVVNRHSGRYLAAEPLEVIAHLIRTGSGPLGHMRDYFALTRQALARCGIRDAGIERVERAIARLDRTAALGQGILSPAGSHTRVDPDACDGSRPSR